MGRLDKKLVDRNLVETRTKAQDLISSSAVLVNGKVQTKSSFAINEKDKIEIKSFDALKYVSRGGFKLEKALKVFNIDLKNKVVMDIGSSTGGFTDCSLQNGAKKVIAIDVGTFVLHKSLRADSRVELHENTNIKNVENSKFKQAEIIVCDVSFVSLERIVEKVGAEIFLGDMICLIKPQFECGKEIATKYGGVIKNKTVHKDVLYRVIKFFNKKNFYLCGLDISPIKGGDGNIEYISHFSNIKNENIKIDITQIVNVAFN